MRLGIVASSGSPWSYSVLEILGELGAEIDLIHVPPESGRAYIDPTSSQWSARVDSLHRVMRSVTIPDLPSGIRRYPALAGTLQTAQKQHGFSKVLTLYGGGFAASAALSKIPFHTYLVGSDVLTGSQFHQIVSRFSLQRALSLFANGPFLTDEARKLCGNTPIQNLLLGINTTQFQIGPVNLSAPVRIICSRGFSPVYNNETIIRALSRLDDIADLFRFDFVAGGDQLRQAMELAEGIFQAGVRTSVHFHGGVSQDELRTILADSEIFVSMSRSDGTSTSLLEALCSGLYPILSDIPPNQNWTEYPDGALVGMDDDEKLADALRFAILNREDLSQNRQARSNHIHEVADSRKNLAQLLESLA